MLGLALDPCNLATLMGIGIRQDNIFVQAYLGIQPAVAMRWIDRDDCEPFIQWMCERIRKDRWSIDGCVGAARLMKSFPGRTIPCTKTLYNMLWANKLPLSLFDLPHALGRKQHRKWNRKNKRMLGRSIEERPAIAAAGTEIGHWEVDTVVGRRQGREAVIFTAVEKVLREFIAIRIPGRTGTSSERAAQWPPAGLHPRRDIDRTLQ